MSVGIADGKGNYMWNTMLLYRYYICFGIIYLFGNRDSLLILLRKIIKLDILTYCCFPLYCI